MRLCLQSHYRWLKKTVVLLPCVLLLACQSRSETVNEVQGMIEAVYPGQFQVMDARLSGDLQGHVLTFKSHQDENFRIELNTRDLKSCKPTGCRDSIEHAHFYGKLAAERLNASLAALRHCGMPILGLEFGSDVPVLEVDIQGDTQAVLERLSPCVEHFRQAIGEVPPEDLSRRHGWSLQLQQAGATASELPSQITWETHAAEHPQAPLYTLWLEHDAPLPPAVAKLGLSLNSAYYKAQKRSILNGVEAYLGAQYPGFGLNQVIRDIRHIWPDSNDISRFHVYVLVCSPAALSARPRNCEQDMALYLYHDSRTGQSTRHRLLRDIRDQHGIVVLPPFPSGDG